VHYVDAASTLACVGSLLAQRPQPLVVVVDNASPDGSGAVVATALADRDGVQVLHAPHNGGFGAGCNFGIAHALDAQPGLGAVLLLNPDAELAPGGLAELLAVQARRGATIVGCRIVDGGGRPWFENGRIPRWTLAGFHVGASAADEHAAEFVTGACMLLDGDAVRAGLRFDEGYFLYCEDADLCERVRADGGGVWLTRRTQVVHRHGGSQPGATVLGDLTASRVYWLTRSKVRFACRHLSWLQRASFWGVAVLAKPLFGAWRERSLRFLSPYLRGLRDGLRDSLRGGLRAAKRA
jgi:GT2 family glycosyltransferase